MPAAANMPSPSIPTNNGQQQNGFSTPPNSIQVVNDDNILLDALYHFGITTLDTDFPSLFGDLKFVCTGGSARRMAKYAMEFGALAGISISENLCRTDRYAIYKTGPVLWINHGMGVPSLSIMLIELFKLLKHSGVISQVEIIRIGTCGGVGVEPGNVIVSNGTMNGALEQKHVQWICGQQVKRDAILHDRLGNDLFETAKNIDMPVQRGVTFCADDFYEGQMRLDGYFREYGHSEKREFMKRISQMGVKNIEMESTGFAALTHRAQIPGAICCVVLVNRMDNDCIKLDNTVYTEFEKRPFRVVSSYILDKIRGQTELNGNGIGGQGGDVDRQITTNE